MTHEEVDLIVVGSGAAGLAAAITARVNGLNVLVCEKTDMIGGASARSGGWLWIPGNPRMREEEACKDIEAARTYIQHHAQEHFDRVRVDSFLRHGREMVNFIEGHTPLSFTTVPDFPDYHPDSPGAAKAGRSIMAPPYDARRIQSRRFKIRPPLDVTTFFGMMIPVTEASLFQSAGRSLRAASHVIRRIIRRGCDQLGYGTTMSLANGNALIAALLETADRLQIPILTNANVVELSRTNRRVTGVCINTAGTLKHVSSKRGVVLATGGFPHDQERRESLTAQPLHDPSTWLAMPPENSGDGLRLAESVGAEISGNVSQPIAMGPVTPFAAPIGNSPAFPHLGARQKPGLIAITQGGERFTNEADSYHDFCKGLIAATRGAAPIAYLICDTRFLRRYGLGFSKPFPIPPSAHLKSGYLKRGRTLAELANKIGVEERKLNSTISDYNLFAEHGEDPKFGRGTNKYHLVQGDPENGPNPCVAPISKPPFYAVKVVAGCVGTFAGVRTDEHARALDSDGEPVEGLYVAGNDMLSVLGGDYIGGGTTLGPAMTFGYIAALHAAAQKCI